MKVQLEIMEARRRNRRRNRKAKNNSKIRFL